MEDSTLIIPFPAEIIDLVFDQMEAKGREKALADFANLARSCRAFTEPALNRLWKVQGNLALLIRCMPEDLWNLEVDKNGKAKELTFRRPIEETDWTRFEYYQWRIRELGFVYGFFKHYLYTHDVHPNVIRALTAYRPAKVFLPNLQRWTVNHHGEELFPFVDAFIGPKLKRVVLDFCKLEADPQTDMYISTFLSSLARLSVNLQYLEFTSILTETSYDPLLNLVKRLQSLRHLVVTHLDICSEALDCLSRLPFLEVLSGFGVPEGEDMPLFTPQDGRFPSLKELTVTAFDYTTAVTLLRALQHPLQLVTIDASEDHFIDNPTRLTLLKQTLSVLEQNHRFSLSKLDINFIPVTRHQVSGQAMSDVFAPLLSCQSLQYLGLKTPFAMLLDDTWLAHAATAWPSLNVLVLMGFRETQGGPAFTLKGLIPLIKGCPRLSELKIPLNLKPLALSSLKGISNWHIKTITLTPGSSLTLPRQVLRSLITMFPKFVRLDKIAGSPGVTERDWQELNGLLLKLTPVREHESSG